MVPEYPAQQEQRLNELQSARERKFIPFFFSLRKKFEAAGVVAPPPPATLQPCDLLKYSRQLYPPHCHRPF